MSETAAQGAPQERAVTEAGEQYARREKKAGRWSVLVIVAWEMGVGVVEVVEPEPRLMPKRGRERAVGTIPRHKERRRRLESIVE